VAGVVAVDIQRLEVANDGRVGAAGGPQEHGLVLVVLVSIEDPIDATTWGPPVGN
jgi:hypothetical protein